MAIQRIDVLGVPVDICLPQELEAEILALEAKPGTKQIVFLSVWDLLRARHHKKDFAQCIREADLILPISKSILNGARFLKKPVPCRYNPFTAVISILSTLESHLKSLYILGGHKKFVMAAERNVRSTFPGMHIVGRYVGYYPKSVEGDIIQAIYKAAPSLVLYSDGIKERDAWAYKRRKQFSSSIFLYYHDAVGIFSEHRKRVSERSFNKGLEIWYEIVHNPLKIFLIIPYLKYLLLLVWYRLFKKETQKGT